MVLCNVNARSVRNKTAVIFDYICERKVDLVAVTEHWLTANDSAVRAELCPVGYSILDHLRIDRHGGGTGLIYRDSLAVSKANAGVSDLNSFEFSEWIVKSSPHNMRLIIIYRPPYSEEHRVPTSVFLSEFPEYLETLLLCKEQLLITGDFNIHVDDAHDSCARKFLEVLEGLGLEQHVDQPTHREGHTLDLLITRMSESLIASTPVVDQFISDHAAVLCWLTPPRPGLSVKTISYRKIKSIDMEQLKTDLQSTALYAADDPTTADELEAYAKEYNTTLSTMLDKHAPLRTRTRVSRPLVPWYSDAIDKAKRSRRKAERKWRRTKLLSDFADYKKKRNYVTNLMNKSRQDFYSKFIEDNSIDQRKLFSAAKKLLGTHNVLRFPGHLDKTVLANDIGKFFVRKIEHIRRDIDSICLSSSDRSLVPPDRLATEVTDRTLRSFDTLSESNVCDLIKNSAKKSCLLDPLPTNLVCDSLEVLLPVITKMVNASLSTAHFPSEWKEAIVNPLLKKGAKDSAHKNLRPVSNLSFVSKITERAVFDQVYTHVTDNELFPVLQSAYRKSHSTETALLKIVNDILLDINRQHVSLLVLLDLSAAFDTVDHTILLRRLERSFGVTGDALKWFTSYLSGRSQRVAVNGELSDRSHLSFGVPQGSCLGPLLFSVYAGKLFEVIKTHLPNVHAYADDTQLYLSFKPGSFESETGAKCAMERCIRAVRAWMVEDKLKLNEEKTEFMLIGTRQQLSKIRTDSLLVGDTPIPSVTEARNLGVWFDSNLHFHNHINKTCQLAFFSLYNIRRIRKYLPFEAAKTLLQALVISRMDYCNSLLYGLPAIHIHKLQRVQNAAARLLTNTPRYAHITPVMIELHWLPVKFRIIFKFNLTIFKALHGLAPAYLSNLLSFKHSNYNLRSNNNNTLARPAVKSAKTSGDRAFLVAAPVLWNALPPSLRAIDNIIIFKRELKTHLFRQAYFVNV